MIDAQTPMQKEIILNVVIMHRWCSESVETTKELMRYLLLCVIGAQSHVTQDIHSDHRDTQRSRKRS